LEDTDQDGVKRLGPVAETLKWFMWWQ
jgi:hypothetical protein